MMLKPSPTTAIPSSSQRSRPVSAARLTAQAASKSAKTSKPSGVLLRLVATLIGVTAKASAASRPVRGPKTRRTRC